MLQLRRQDVCGMFVCMGIIGLTITVPLFSVATWRWSVKLHEPLYRDWVPATCTMQQQQPIVVVAVRPCPDRPARERLSWNQAWCQANTAAQWPAPVNAAVVKLAAQINDSATSTGLTVPVTACCLHPDLVTLQELGEADILNDGSSTTHPPLCTCGNNGTSGTMTDDGNTGLWPAPATALPAFSNKLDRATGSAPPRVVCTPSYQCSVYFEQLFRSGTATRQPCAVRVADALAIVDTRTSAKPPRLFKAIRANAVLFLVISACVLVAVVLLPLACMCCCLGSGCQGSSTLPSAVY